MKIDIRSDKSLYVTMDDVTFYIDNSTNERIVDVITEDNDLDNGFPFMEGDDYWVIEDDGGLSTLSCWDDMSEEMHLENPNRKYFSSEEEGLKYIKSQEK